MANFLKHVSAVVAALGPILFVLEGAPGTAGKVAAGVVAVLGAFGLLHTAPPVKAAP